MLFVVTMDLVKCIVYVLMTGSVGHFVFIVFVVVVPMADHACKR